MKQEMLREMPATFPPAWAELWGEDEYGLYADMVFRAEEFGAPNASENKSFQKTSEQSMQLSTDEVTQRFRWIASGDFLMGSPSDEPERSGAEDQHQVTLTQGYWLADTTVTQALWKLVVGKKPARFKEDLNNPVEKVSWNDSQEFINSISQKFAELFGGLVLRLPTEAEWEHACRAATTTPFSFGDNVTSEQVNFDGSNPYNNGKKSKYRKQTVVVKSLPPNAWGLYEMHGNVWEWCADAWENNLGSQPMVDPCHSGDSGADRVLRGGSWIINGRRVRSACRIHDRPGHRGNSVGLRLSLGPELKARSAK